VKDGLICRDGDEEADEMSLAGKIAAWGSMTSCSRVLLIAALKVENAVTRPDALGTGNEHRKGISPTESSHPQGLTTVPIHRYHLSSN
jgi:hypothetical protein